jgi:hypothetical protein
MKFNTVSAVVSGAVVGPIWQGPVCGLPVKHDLNNTFLRGPGSPRTFKQALGALLRVQGDFQSARFAADTTIRVERVGYGRLAGMRFIHVREIPVARVAPELLDFERYTYDFIDS